MAGLHGQRNELTKRAPTQNNTTEKNTVVLHASSGLQTRYDKI
jgi:hypothetical protein